MKYTLIFCTLFIFCASVVSAQINIDNINLPQDSSYHCNACKSHLFHTDDATILNKKALHYHGVATDSSKTSFHCAGCNGHLGYYQHDEKTYQVLGNKLDEKDTGKFHCLSCQMPLFDKQSLSSSDESYSYFSAPLDEERIALEERNKFYKIQNSAATCGRCDAVIGEANENDSGGFGLRINLGAVGKKKKQKNLINNKWKKSNFALLQH